MREYRTFNIAPAGIVQNPDPPAPITAMEYFIDVDPGVGNGIPLSSFPGTSTSVDFSDIIEASAVSEGLHVVCIRGRDSDGQWGMYEKRTFQVRPNGVVQVPDPPEQIVAMEYFIDTDPGVGNGTALPNFSGPTLNIDFTDIAIANGLSNGLHIICVRAQDSNGDWGPYEKRTFVVRPINVATGGTASNIVALEYFFGDEDPGPGNGIDIPVSPSQATVDLNQDWSTAMDIPIGTNKVSVRALNDQGLWGFTETREFEVVDDCTFPNLSFDVQIGCATDATQFTDTSFDIIPTEDPQYRWYFDGDAIVDDNTAGSTSWTYGLPGSYNVSLAVTQGATCTDSITTNITIKPKPVVVFSAANAFAGEITQFNVVAVNVEPTMNWSWDFDNDGLEDDNTQGNNTFVFASAGTYPVTLSVGDPNGCGTTFNADVIIADAPGTGGGSGTPEVDFSATTVCEGTTTQFTNLSSSIPGGATYSWDFDNDGIEDDNTVGSTTFDYPDAGSYITRLTVTLPDATVLTKNVSVTVKPIPTVDFTVADACTSDQIDITDNTTDVIGGATYSWDFDGDGAFDDTTIGDVSTSFDNDGTYTVLLLVNNGDGCFGTKTKQVQVFDIPTVAFSTSQACLGDEMTFTNESENVEINAVYSWDLDGDAIEDFNTGGNKQFTYSSAGVYSSSLTINNGADCEATFEQDISISLRPTADINVIARCFGQESTIEDLSLNVETDATYSWDLDGDGGEDDTTVGSTTFVYPAFDSYIAKLTVDNGDGCTSSASAVVNFVDAAIPVFSIGSISCVDVPVAFNDSSYQKEPGATYGWDFNGDGIIDEETPGSTSHTYSIPGVYDARLQIDNGNNCLAERIVEVNVGGRPLVSVTDTILCVASTVELDAGTGYEGYRWFDATGNLTTNTNQTYTVDEIGDFVVEVTDAKGCINTDTANVQLKGPPIVDFEYSLLYTEFGIQVSFQNQSTNADSYVWNFGDGLPVDNEFESNPEHLYNTFSFFESTIYEVCLTATNFCDEVTNCQSILLSPTHVDDDILEGLVKIYPNPGNGFYTLDLLDEGLIGARLQIIDNSGTLLSEQVVENRKPSIDITNRAKGVYHMRLVKNESEITKSLIYK